MSAFHSAVRGAQMLTFGVLEWAVRYGYLGAGSAKASSPAFMALASVIAAVGYYRQLRTVFALGPVEGFVLLPVRIAENLLVEMVGAAPAPTG